MSLLKKIILWNADHFNLAALTDECLTPVNDIWSEIKKNPGKYDAEIELKTVLLKSVLYTILVISD